MVMFVRIRCLRRGGRPIPAHEADRPDHELTGDLRSSRHKLELHAPLQNVDALATLYEFRVVCFSAGSGGFLVRGIEQHNGCAVLQEWIVTPLECVVGEDGLCRWNFPG